MRERQRKAAQGQMLGLVSGNLRELRKRGGTSADCLALEKLAILARKGRGIVRPSDLGRMLGISRSGAHSRLRRLEALGVIVRLGRAVMLNVRGLLAMAVDAAKARTAHLSALIAQRKMANRQHGATHTRQTDTQRPKAEEKGLEQGPERVWQVGDRAEDGRRIVGQRRHGTIFVPIWA